VNLRAVRAIVVKDLRMVLRSRPVLAPMLVLPGVLLVLTPVAIALVMHFLAGRLDAPIPAENPTLVKMLARLPADLRDHLSRATAAQFFVEWVLVYAMAPLFLFIPSFVAGIAAADSFAGEKERRSVEALLYTPIPDAELFFAKALPAWLAAVVVDLVGFAVYVVVANAAAWPTLGRLILPDATWLVLALWTGPAVAGLGLGISVLVSSRVRGFQEATQLSALLVLPLTGLSIAQVLGAMAVSPWVVALLGLGLWAAAALLVFVGARTFRRDRQLPA